MTRFLTPFSRFLPGLALATALTGCSHALPSINGAPSAPQTPSDPWRVPHDAVPREPVRALPGIPEAVAPRANALGLNDILDLALRNNPQTRLSWAQAQAGAATYGAARALLVPTIDATSNIADQQTTSQTGSSRRNTIIPTVTLNYLLLDFGGRGGTIEAARAAAMALDLTHNAAIQNVALDASVAYFTYQSQRQLVIASRLSLADADTNLSSARQRNQAGVATIADVLQAQTLQAQAQFNLETANGLVQAARASLAATMGLQANTRFELAPMPDSINVNLPVGQVDTLIDRALALRPDLASLRASILQAQANVRVARSAEYPTISLGSNGGKTFSDVNNFVGFNYGISLGIQIPIFNLARPFNVKAAEAQVNAASARADLLRTQVAQQVYTSYYALQTATQRFRTAEVVLSTAIRSEEVARTRYRSGVGTIIDLISAQTALANARAQQAQARGLWGQALAQLTHDVGVLGPRGDGLPSGVDAIGVRP
jgi:outer membrane protein TolC